MFGAFVPLKTLFTALTEPLSTVANRIDDPFEEVMFDEPDAITISPFWSEPVMVDNRSKLPLLCLIICALF